jgi:hypothetical protein
MVLMGASGFEVSDRGRGTSSHDLGSETRPLPGRPAEVVVGSDEARIRFADGRKTIHPYDGRVFFSVEVTAPTLSARLEQVTNTHLTWRVQATTWSAEVTTLFAPEIVDNPNNFHQHRGDPGSHQPGSKRGGTSHTRRRNVLARAKGQAPAFRWSTRTKTR